MCAEQRYVVEHIGRKHIQNEVFNRLFSEAETARFSRTELKEYEDSLKAYRDIKNSLDTAKEEGRAEGCAEVAKTMLANGFNKTKIAQMTGLSIAEIETMLL